MNKIIIIVTVFLVTLILNINYDLYADDLLDINSENRLKVNRVLRKAFHSETNKKDTIVNNNRLSDTKENQKNILNVGVVNIDKNSKSPKEVIIVIPGDVININNQRK